MINLFKADVYRIAREKVGAIPLGILTLIIVAMSFFSREYKSVSVLTLLEIVSLILVLTVISSSLYFWGNDFQHRTVNNLISKKVPRWKLFSYKVLATMLLSAFYALFAFVLLGLCRQLFSGANEWTILAESFAQSLLFFLVIVAFAILIFNIFKGNALAITSYVVYLLVGEQVVMMAMSYLLQGANLADIFWVRNYQAAIQQVNPIMLVSAVVSLLVFITVSYFLFSKHELK